MLKRLRFTNFKSWKEADLACAPITGIFGTNSSGKTGLIQFLLLLKQTKDATDRAIALDLNGALVQLGTMTDAMHRHDVRQQFDIELEFQLREELLLSNPSDKRKSLITRGRELGVAAQIGVKQLAPSARRLEYKLGNSVFELSPRNGDQSEFELRAGSSHAAKESFSFIRAKGRPWQLPGPVKTFGFPDQVRTYFQNTGFLADLQASYERALDSVFYLGPLREFPKRDYLWSRSRPTDVGQRGEKAIDAILAATEAKETRNFRRKTRRKEFQETIAQLLKQMGLIESFRVVEIKEGSNRWQALITAKKEASEVFLTDVGFGVSQVLPVVTLLQYVPEHSTVILEQPEIHLHPSAQAELADVIIQAATERHVQVILESHSEHLLLRLQRRVAEEKIQPEDLKLYFCDAPRGVSTLKKLDVDLFGNIRNWPENFMGNAFAETAEAELARLKRLKAAE